MSGQQHFPPLKRRGRQSDVVSLLRFFSRYCRWPCWQWREGFSAVDIYSWGYNRCSHCARCGERDSCLDSDRPGCGQRALVLLP